MIQVIKNIFKRKDRQLNLPVVRCSKINTHKEALEYIVKNESGTMEQLRKDIDEDIIKGLQLTGYIKT